MRRSSWGALPERACARSGALFGRVSTPLPSGQTEVHVVLVARPIAAPFPPDGSECADDAVVGMDHPGPAERAVPEGSRVLVAHVAIERYIRVLDGVDVDGPSVRVLGERVDRAASGEDRPAIEPGRVVAFVVWVVVVRTVPDREAHGLDGKPGLEQGLEHRDDLSCDDRVHDHGTLVDPSVESPVAKG